VCSGVGRVNAWTTLAAALAAGTLGLAACTEVRPPIGGPPPTLSPSAPSRHAPPHVDERSYPFTFGDVRRVPLSAVSVTGSGPPPRIPWSSPTRSGTVMHLGDETVRVPAWAIPRGTLGGRLVLEGGCTRPVERCGDRPRGGVHLLSPTGRYRSLDSQDTPHDVSDVVDSPAGDRIWWWTEDHDGPRLFHYAAGDPSPTQLPVPAVAGPRTHTVLSGIIGRRDVLLRHWRRATTYHTRTSGRPAPWNADHLTPVTAGALLGAPGFTPPREDCLSMFTTDSPRPRWTRCYRSGPRRVDGFYSISPAPGGRWLVTKDRQDVILIDARTGLVAVRLRLDEWVQDVAFEDPTHFLLVVSQELPAGSDAWPVQWIVRCSLEPRCERATEPTRITVYDSLRLFPPGDLED